MTVDILWVVVFAFLCALAMMVLDHYFGLKKRYVALFIAIIFISFGTILLWDKKAEDVVIDIKLLEPEVHEMVRMNLVEGNTEGFFILQVDGVFQYVYIDEGQLTVGTTNEHMRNVVYKDDDHVVIEKGAITTCRKWGFLVGIQKTEIQTIWCEFRVPKGSIFKVS